MSLPNFTHLADQMGAALDPMMRRTERTQIVARIAAELTCASWRDGYFDDGDESDANERQYIARIACDIAEAVFAELDRRDREALGGGE